MKIKITNYLSMRLALNNYLLDSIVFNDCSEITIEARKHISQNIKINKYYKGEQQ